MALPFGPFGARVTGLLREGADIVIAKSLGSFTTFGQVTGFIVRNFGLGLPEASRLGSFVVAEVKAGRDLGSFVGDGAYPIERIPGYHLDFKGQDPQARFQVGVEIQFTRETDGVVERQFWTMETDNVDNPDDIFASVWDRIEGLADQYKRLREFIDSAEGSGNVSGRIAFVKRRF